MLFFQRVTIRRFGVIAPNTLNTGSETASLKDCAWVKYDLSWENRVSAASTKFQKNLYIYIYIYTNLVGGYRFSSPTVLLRYCLVQGFGFKHRARHHGGCLPVSALDILSFTVLPRATTESFATVCFVANTTLI